MRITFTDVDKFCAELRQEAGSIVWKQVRVRVDRVAEQDEGVSFAMAIWGTALIEKAGVAGIIEYGEWCGSDEPSNPDGGTTVANNRRARIEKAAKEIGLEIRDGKFEG